ncbi:MAG: AMP-binding protein [Clostridia bacterium]|nr:AMP-binding protein [Clostridia bacterium]
MTEPRETKLRDLREFLEDCARRYGTKSAFRDKRDGIYQDISYARYAKEAKALALMLSSRIAPGERVLIVGENAYRWALSYMATILLGAVPVPVDDAMRTRDMVAIAKAAGITAILYSPAERRKRKALTGVTAVCFDKYPALVTEGKRRLASGDYAVPAPALDPDGLATLFFTPGTVKGVMLSHQNILATLRNMGEMMAIDTEDVFLSHLPLSHAYECVCGFLAPLYYGATVAFAEGLHSLLTNMREIHPTCMVTLPFIAEALYRKCMANIQKEGREARVRRYIAVSEPVRPLSVRQAMKERLLARDRAYFGGNLRRMLILGGAMDASVQKGLRRLGVLAVQGYGMTECAGLAALNRDDRYRDGAAGLAFPGTMLDIYNAQPDGSGEIRYKGENVMLGYLNDPELTAKALNGGWYYTGDIGRIDDDGFLYILGRRQNCIETLGGRLICPEALERLLCQSPFIKEAVVVGTLNGETRDSEPAAVILPDETYAAEADAEAAIDEWIAQINNELPLYQQIGCYALREKPFPKDAAGRVRRAAVAAEFAAEKKGILQ